LDFANGENASGFVHPVVRAIILHFWLAYDHPFLDGNGRTARGLFYWSMLSQRYWLFDFVSISHILRKAPSKYAQSFLCTETDDNDLTYFVLYQLKVIRRAISELHKYLTRKIQEVKHTEKLIRESGRFNHRQLALLGHALRHPDATYSIQSHKNSHSVSYQTARTDLLNLGARGYLTQTQIGNAYYFTPGPKLTSKMQ
jgi:Fic family protein